MQDPIDSIPAEGTWQLDEGERVVDPKTVTDLKRANMSILKNIDPQFVVEQAIGLEKANPGMTVKEYALQIVDAYEAVATEITTRLQASKDRDQNPGL